MPKELGSLDAGQEGASCRPRLCGHPWGLGGHWLLCHGAFRPETGGLWCTLKTGPWPTWYLPAQNSQSLSPALRPESAGTGSVGGSLTFWKQGLHQAGSFWPSNLSGGLA